MNNQQFEKKFKNIVVGDRVIDSLIPSDIKIDGITLNNIEYYCVNKNDVVICLDVENENIYAYNMQIKSYCKLSGMFSVHDIIQDILSGYIDVVSKKLFDLIVQHYAFEI